MARRWSFYEDVLPVVVIIGIECSDTGLFTLFKAATLKGMSDHVFVAYAYAIATTVLLPSVFITKRLAKQYCKMMNTWVNSYFFFMCCFSCLFADQEWFLHLVSPY